MSMRSGASVCQLLAVSSVPRAALTGRAPVVVMGDVMCPFQPCRWPSVYAHRYWCLKYEIRGAMPGNAPAATRALAVLRLMASASGP